MRGHRIPAAFLLACALGACGSTPPQLDLPPRVNPGTQDYWENPQWRAELFVAVQSVVHLPANASSSSTTGIHGTVQFRFDNGAINDPAIVASTGDPYLDKLMLQQVVTTKIPKPIGLHSDQPHEFELALDMPTYFEWFENNVYAAIDSKKLFPRDALVMRHTGSTAVDFDYLDGKTLNIVIAKSSGHVELDKTSINTVSKAELPAAPPGNAGKTIPIEVIICYDIDNSIKCPTGSNVIDVEAVRIR